MKNASHRRRRDPQRGFHTIWRNGSPQAFKEDTKSLEGAFTPRAENHCRAFGPFEKTRSVVGLSGHTRRQRSSAERSGHSRTEIRSGGGFSTRCNQHSCCQPKGGNIALHNSYLLKGHACRGYLTQSPRQARHALGVGGRSCLSTRHSETSCPVGGMRYSLGAQPKAASGGGLKPPALSPLFSGNSSSFSVF